MANEYTKLVPGQGVQIQENKLNNELVISNPVAAQEAEKLRNEFEAIQQDVIDEFKTDADAAIEAIGYSYLDPATFNTGATLTEPSDALLWSEADGGNDEYYRWSGALPKEVPAGSTPDSTGGVSVGAWRAAGSGALKQELSEEGAGKGVALVKGAEFNVDSLINLLDVPFIDGRFYRNGGFYPNTVVGRGAWKAVASKPKSDANVLDVITVEQLQAWRDAAVAAGGVTKQNLHANLNVLWETSATGTGAFVRVGRSKRHFHMGGAVADGVFDDTYAIQKCLYARGDGNPTSGILPIKDELSLEPLPGTYLLTDRIHHPSHVQVVSPSGVGLNPNNGWDVSQPLSSVLFKCEFTNTAQSAWVISGYARNGKSGLLNTDYIDPYQVGTSGTEFDNGDVTRTVRVRLDGVHFLTTNYIACPVSTSAASDAIIRYSSYGFLHAGCHYSNWTLDIAMYGLAYHSGGFFFSCNAVTAKGYTSRFTTDSSPTTVQASKPVGWQDTEVFSYTGADRYMSTGLYIAFCNSFDSSVFTSEKFDRARLYWDSFGVAEATPYLEKINTVAFHNINSKVFVSTPFLNQVPALSRTGGGSTDGFTVIEGLGDYGDVVVGSVNEVGGPTTVVRTTNNGRVEAAEPYKSSVKWEFYDQQFNQIYVSATGSDSNTGLSSANAVLTIDTAIDRAKHYGVNRIKVADGETVNITTSNKVLDFDVKIYSDTGATVNPQVSAGQIRSVRFFGGKVYLERIDMTIPASTVDGERAPFKPYGSSSLETFLCNITCDASSALFSSISNIPAVFQFTYTGGSLSAANLSLNDSGNSGAVKVIPVIGGSVTKTGTLTWSSTFTVI